MMLSAFLLLSGLSVSYGGQRNFVPSKPEGMDHHKERVWLWLHPKCFAMESDVFDFKDFLLSEYNCLAFNKNRKKIYKATVAEDRTVWSLWMEAKHHRYGDLECLSQNISMPNEMEAECVTAVMYEPLQYIQQDGAQCVDQPTGSNPDLDLWSVDVLDGVSDGLYNYLEYGSSSAAGSSVEAIILDTDVDTTHVEFSGLTVNNLFDGVLNPSTTQFHGTHVAGTVVGSLVGGAKQTNFNYYPVCQSGSGCAWSDIEGGYNAAIELMESNPATTYVINYSVGGTVTALSRAAYNAWGQEIQNAGGFWVTSAGNSAADACNFAPAFSEYAITVGAYAANLGPATRFTNYGSCVDTWGPGDIVYSAADGGGYAAASGTSMASPNIASIVINALKETPELDLDAMKQYLVDNSQPLLNVPSSWPSSRRAYLASCF